MKKGSDFSAFQGAGRRAPYFEGWYFKLQTSGGRSLILIPGVSVGADGSFSFIQAIDSEKEGSRMYRFPMEQFSYTPGKLAVSIAGNRFSKEGVELCLGGDEGFSGSLRFTRAAEWPRSPLMPGIMGPFSFVPMRECRHDVVLMRFVPEGTVAMGGKPVRFDGGSGYVEKDWGGAFPSGYLWAQGCSFPRGASFMLAAARVPALGFTFTGLIGFLYDGACTRLFATYRGARLERLESAAGYCDVLVKAPGLRLSLHARPDPSRALSAPQNGGMGRQVHESVGCRLEIELKSAGGHVLYSGEDLSAGFEIGGNMQSILKKE